VPARVASAFGALILAQAAHSVEEYLGRLWESFPPARLVSAAFSPDLERGFLLANAALLTFGLWCWWWPVRRDWPSARPLAWVWVVIEVVNGVGHPAWALRQGRYVPGLATAPVLLVLALCLASRLRAVPRRVTGVAILLLSLGAVPTGAQQIAPDSAASQIRGVLRAFYLHYQSQDWEALSAYVLSPKLLERRGVPGSRQAARNRARGRASSHSAAVPVTCTGTAAPRVDEATIRVDGDWADVSVPRCGGTSAGVDEFGMLYFENRWRFIYTDLFEGR
jgi:hypothetical protein